ncbi:MAG: phage major capsid protein [Burkholderiales bacterium]
MNYEERISAYANRQRRNTETLDFFRYVFARAKHPAKAGGSSDVIGMRRTLERFGSVRIDGIMHRKAAVDGATTHGSGWASELADFSALAAEWNIQTSAKSFIGGALRTRRIPFDVRVISTSAPNATFVGEGLGIAPAALNLEDSTRLGRTKVATIAVVSKESVEVWQPGTRENLEAVLTRSVVRGLDLAALDPEKAAVTGERPASLLNGVVPIALMGSTVSTVLSQVKSMLEALVAAGSDLESAAFVMHPIEALTLSTMITTEGVRAFPEMGAMGGSILGIPAHTSAGAVRTGSPSERVFAVVDGAQIAVADDNGIEISASEIASLHQDDATTMSSTATATGAATVSMFITESVAIKVVRVMNWERLADSAVSWLSVMA